MGDEPKPRRRAPRLETTMACETAFRIIARHCLEELQSHRPAAGQSDRDAVHDMRVALTRLRSAVALFSPMVADSEALRLKGELKWLNGVLGAARDMDVAVDRLKALRAPRLDAVEADRLWHKLHADSHRRLAQALRSTRYRRLIGDISDWVENGTWCRDAQTAKLRATSLARYGTRKLERWHDTLTKAAERLEQMGVKRRHRLRRRSKRLRYAVEFVANLLQDSCARSTLKHLRKAQSCLGELNDASRRMSIAASLDLHDPDWLTDDLDAKRERRLLRGAAQAYRKLPALIFKDSAVPHP
jgi:CHAD domain-containing protein